MTTIRFVRLISPLFFFATLFAGAGDSSADPGVRVLESRLPCRSILQEDAARFRREIAALAGTPRLVRYLRTKSLAQTLYDARLNFELCSYRIIGDAKSRVEAVVRANEFLVLGAVLRPNSAVSAVPSEIDPSYVETSFRGFARLLADRAPVDPLNAGGISLAADVLEGNGGPVATGETFLWSIPGTGQRVTPFVRSLFPSTYGDAGFRHRTYAAILRDFAAQVRTGEWNRVVARYRRAVADVAAAEGWEREVQRAFSSVPDYRASDVPWIEISSSSVGDRIVSFAQSSYLPATEPVLKFPGGEGISLKEYGFGEKHPYGPWYDAWHLRVFGVLP